MGNRLSSVTLSTGGAATSFKYDGDGHLVAKLVGNVTTYYVGGVYEVEVTNTTVSKKTTYYPAGGALRVEDVVAGTNKVYYVLKDRLGSASVTLDANGSTYAEMRYYPFGETRVTSGTMPTDRLFTSQKQIASIGLYSYGARMYNPKIGRFISADTIVPNFANPQSLNRFAYALNNPLKYIDPTGHTPAPSYCSRYPAECQANPATRQTSYGPPSSGGNISTSSTTTSTTGQPTFCQIYVAECQFASKGGNQNATGIPAAKYYSCASTTAKPSCVSDYSSVIDKMTFTVYWEGGGYSSRMAANIIQTINNRAYNYWMCSSNPNCTAHKYINPTGVAWEDISPSQYAALVLFILSEPYPGRTGGVFPSYNAWGASEPGQIDSSKWSAIKTTMSNLILSSGQSSVLVNGRGPDPNVSGNKDVMYYAVSTTDPAVSGAAAHDVIPGTANCSQWYTDFPLWANTGC